MGRKRVAAKHLPPHLYIVKRKRPYKLVRPDGTSTTFADFQSAIAEWAVWWGPSTQSTQAGRLMDEYLAREVPKLRERTQKDYALHLTFLRAGLGDQDIRRITPAVLYEYQETRAESSVHQANREMAVMSNVFKLAIKKGIRDDNPCKYVSRLTEYARDRDVQPAEFQAVYDRADTVVKVAMMLTAITGMREGDILALRRDAFTDEGLHYTESKSQRTAAKRGGKKRLWEWTPNLRWIHETGLALHPKKRPSLHFLYLTAKHRKSGFYHAWRNAMDKAMEDGEVVERYTFHDLRAYAANEADNPYELLAHSDGSVTIRHYTNRRARKTTPLA